MIYMHFQGTFLADFFSRIYLKTLGNCIIAYNIHPAPANSTVIFLKELGTGKNLIANTITIVGMNIQKISQ
ncbi:MAG: hypothetical protein HPY90_13930 [Syntrophothermus sp.]|uniref:hypothetical protein n=1 Tax=Syntrophothermus sp. TaxID=2736299 RepID=UPI00257C5EDB|nr:hypothetical protein [Syntrophothermus sp.]NSW84339.1 hypothetical protein [Syntrophothermus sp.]